jgi:hypothetical protein
MKASGTGLALAPEPGSFLSDDSPWSVGCFPRSPRLGGSLPGMQSARRSQRDGQRNPVHGTFRSGHAGLSGSFAHREPTECRRSARPSTARRREDRGELRGPQAAGRAKAGSGLRPGEALAAYPADHHMGGSKSTPALATEPTTDESPAIGFSEFTNSPIL